VEGYVHLEALPPVLVKGKDEPVAPYNVLGTRPQRSPLASRGERTLSQFVGRERELTTLTEIFEQVESGQGQVVGIVAEAGGGKSRLLYEFRQRLAGEWVTYLDGRCLSYGHAMPYHPIIALLRHNCGITEVDSPEAIAEKVCVAPQESVTVVRSARQHHALPEHLEQMIIARAEGNPFFLEELTRAVLDHADVAPTSRCRTPFRAYSWRALTACRRT